MNTIRTCPEHFWLCDVPGEDSFDCTGPLTLGALYDAMKAEKLLSVFLYDGVPCRDAFIDFFNRDERWTYAAFDEEGRPLVMAVVSNVSGCSGLAHFCYFRAGRSFARRLAGEWLAMLAEGGMQSLVGMTPAVYRHALHFAESVGFRRMGLVPGACVLAAHHNRICSAVLTVLDLRGYLPPLLSPGKEAEKRAGEEKPLDPQGSVLCAA